MFKAPVVMFGNFEIFLLKQVYGQRIRFISVFIKLSRDFYNCVRFRKIRYSIKVIDFVEILGTFLVCVTVFKSVQGSLSKMRNSLGTWYISHLNQRMLHVKHSLLVIIFVIERCIISQLLGGHFVCHGIAIRFFIIIYNFENFFYLNLIQTT